MSDGLTALRETTAGCEAAPSDLPRESVLSELWQTQRYRKGALALRDGSPVRVIYRGLFELGHCHTVEVYDQAGLVGGLYGVSLGRAFFARLCRANAWVRRFRRAP